MKPNTFDVSYLLSSNLLIIIVHINILFFCLSCLELQQRKRQLVAETGKNKLDTYLDEPT